jgi:2-polyprenyl-3-methyl-5-hydroxy-6-metoxy-1,4-benzoquinol methylase
MEGDTKLHWTIDEHRTNHLGERMTNTPQYRLEKHPEFGFFQVKPTPSSDEITRFYTEEFYSTKYKAFNNSALEVQEADREFHDAHRENIAQKIESLLGHPLAGTSILDIGCGWGQTMSYLASRGAVCSGFDPAPEAVAHVQSCGLECVQAGMDRMDVFTNRRFDVVMLMNVLEHLSNPVQVINDIHRTILNDGGLLIVEVPNEFNPFQTAGQELHGLPQWWVAPPGHLNYFSATTLSHLLNASGFAVAHRASSFPLEMFLLMGDKYVGNRELGRLFHERRMAFEMNLRRLGRADVLESFYEAMASVDLGRQVTAYARRVGTDT